MKGNDIVAKAKKGDQKSMEKLYNQNFDSLYKFIWHKVMDDEIAKDLCAESFVRAFEGIERFKEDSSFKTWVYGIANNLVIDWIKHKMKNSVWNDEEDCDIAERSEKNDNEEIFLLVNTILNELKENYKKILELRYLMNYSVKETAKALDISVSNAKVMQMRALRKAQKIYLSKLNTKN